MVCTCYAYVRGGPMSLVDRFSEWFCSLQDGIDLYYLRIVVVRYSHEPGHRTCSRGGQEGVSKPDRQTDMLLWGAGRRYFCFCCFLTP